MTAIGDRHLRRRRRRQNELPAVARRRHHPVELGVPLRRAVARGRRVLLGEGPIHSAVYIKNLFFSSS